MIRATQKPQEVKRDRCVRCGLIFGSQQCCPKCNVELERAYLAEPMRHLKEGYVCQFCALDMEHMPLQDINKEKPGWWKYNKTGEEII
jgi:hypothetical protein